MTTITLNVIHFKKEKQEEQTISVDVNTNIDTLKKIVSEKTRIPSSQVGIYIEEDGKDGKKTKTYFTNIYKTIESLGWKNSQTIYVKNQGFQMFRRFIYFIEYFGPLVIILVYYFFRLTPQRANVTQNLATLMATFHYLKRVIESIYVHQFSFNYLPFMNLIINCTYYWGLFGFNIGHFVLSPEFVESTAFGKYKIVFIILFFSAELQNLQCHLHLKNIKEENKGERAIPTKHGFELVSMANYFWEFLSWLFFSLYVNHPSAYVFCFAGLAIMSNWALKRHQEYKKTFGTRYPKSRKAIIPFIL